MLNWTPCNIQSNGTPKQYIADSEFVMPSTDEEILGSIEFYQINHNGMFSFTVEMHSRYLSHNLVNLALDKKLAIVDSRVVTKLGDTGSLKEAKKMCQHHQLLIRLKT